MQVAGWNTPQVRSAPMVSALTLFCQALRSTTTSATPGWAYIDALTVNNVLALTGLCDYDDQLLAQTRGEAQNWTATVVQRIEYVQAHGSPSTRSGPTATTRPSPTTTRPRTTTTASSSTACFGQCKYAFPQPDTDGFISAQLNEVKEAVGCPDPGGCDATPAQHIIEVSVTMCAGASGVADAGHGASGFSLALSDGTQAKRDGVTADSNVSSAFGNYGAVAPHRA